MENLLAIISTPDNVPVIGMVVALAIVMWVWFKEVRKHDKMIKEGRKKDIYEEMAK